MLATKILHNHALHAVRAVATRGTCPPPIPVFVRSVNPVSTRRHIMPTALLRALPDLATALAVHRGQKGIFNYFSKFSKLIFN